MPMREPLQDEADEALSEILKCEACEPRGCASDRLRHTAAPDGLLHPQTPPAGDGTGPAGELRRGAEQELEYLPGRRYPATPGDWMLGLNFLIPLDIWRELRNARDAAIQRYYASIERRNDFVTRMVADVAQNYYGLMALDQRLAILD